MDEAIKERIRKLLALGGNNPNENEAKNALNKAAALAAEHGMSIEGIDAETGEVSNVEKTTLTVSHSRNKNWESQLIATISLCFDLEIVYTTYLNDAKWFTFGTKSDLEIGLWYFKYCRMHILRSAKQKYDRKRDQVAYGLGAARSLHTRLYGMFYEERQKQENDNTRALIVVKKEEVKKEKNREFPKTRKMQTRANVGNQNAGAYRQGESDGQKMPLHRGHITA